MTEVCSPSKQNISTGETLESNTLSNVIPLYLYKTVEVAALVNVVVSL